MQKYKAIAYSDDFDDGRESGLIYINGDTLIFEHATFEWQIAKSDISLEHGGTAGRQIFITSNKNQYRISTAETDLIKHPFFHHGNVSTQTANIVKQRNKSQLAIVAAFVTFGVIIGGIIWQRANIANYIATKVPYSIEQSLGETYIKQISATDSLDTSSPMWKALHQKIQLLTSQVDTSFAFKMYISSSEDVNAYALPGGYIVFNRGLLREADNWEEVLGVAGHEMAHVTEKHHVRGIVSQVGVVTLLSMFIGDGSALMDILLGAGAKIEGLSYSRDYETESDVKGFEYLTKANINPQGLRTFFKKLEDLHGHGGAQDALEFVSTHPSPANRVANLEKLEKDRPKNNYLVLDDYASFKKLLPPDPDAATESTESATEEKAATKK